jgi:hypothetical protein
MQQQSLYCREGSSMATDDSSVNFWSLTSVQLAAQIGLIAHGESKAVDDATRAEAGVLAVEWQEALSLPEATFEDQEQRTARLDSLQKRTIEILVGASQGA